MKNETKVLLFGAGSFGRRSLLDLREDYHILGFIDNDPEKEGKECAGLPVYRLQNAPVEQVSGIIITSSFYSEIMKQLEQAGLTPLVIQPIADHLDDIPTYKEANQQLCRAIQDNRNLNGTVLYDVGIYRGIKNTLSEYSIPKDCCSFLQIGAGNSLGLEYLLGLDRRFSTIVAYEPFYKSFDLLATQEAFQQMFLLLNESLGEMCQMGFSHEDHIEVAAKHHWGINDSTIRVVSDRPFEENILDEKSFDIVFSNAVLEHVRDPRKTISESFRILKPGGLSIHQIDLRDHADFSKPLEFLKVSEEEWVDRMAFHGGTYLNRWRSTEFIDAFSDAGFNIEKYDPNMKTEAGLVDGLKNQFVEKYRNMDTADLEHISCYIVARKPNGECSE